MMVNIRMLRRRLRGAISRQALLDGPNHEYTARKAHRGFSRSYTEYDVFFSQCDLSLGN
jgi:hypothetical protein